MLTTHYIGNHAGDNLAVRAGAWLTRKVQKGPLGIVTHVEAIHKEHSDGSVTIASSSLRDNGVRDKTTFLNPTHWMIVDVPNWSIEKSIDLLYKTKGEQYDIRGAIATVFIGSPNPDKWFCNKWVGHPFITASGIFSPSQFAAICLTLGNDVTTDFFASRDTK